MCNPEKMAQKPGMINMTRTFFSNKNFITDEESKSGNPDHLESINKNIEKLN